MLRNGEVHYPRVLVISYNSFSQSDANGRTLSNLFIYWKKTDVAQFYMMDEVPDFKVCGNYYRITDADALKAFLKGSKVGRQIKPECSALNGTNNYQKIYNHSKKNKKRYIYKIIRNLVWNSGRWRNEDFNNWVDDFNPEAVLLFAGNSAFIYKIALQLAKQRSIPLVVYNCEDYCLKDRGFVSLPYQIYLLNLRYVFRKTMQYASFAIYNSNMLEKSYNKMIKHKSTVIYNPTDVAFELKDSSEHVMRISYLGNLKVGRHLSLIQMADALQRINQSLILDVYGSIPNREIYDTLISCQGICYKGVVGYNECINIMRHSDLLIHVESFSEFSRKDLKHAFSTKIADSLACGTCMAVYAPEDLACIQYLLKWQAACIITQREDLVGKLRELLASRDLRLQYIENAKKLVAENHSPKEAFNSFYTVIQNSLDNCGKVYVDI